jgi:hypothetical protein
LISKGNEFDKSGKVAEHPGLVAVDGNLKKLSEALRDLLTALGQRSGYYARNKLSQPLRNNFKQLHQNST